MVSAERLLAAQPVQTPDWIAVATDVTNHVHGHCWDRRTRQVMVRVRTAEPADLAALTDIFRRSSLSNERDRPNLLAHPEVLELSETSIAERRTRVATVRGGRIVGFVTTELMADALELEDLFVDPDWMRRGIGLELITDAMATARDRGIDRIVVTANPHAQPFYEKAGFVYDGEAETRFGPAPRMHADVVVEG